MISLMLLMPLLVTGTRGGQLKDADYLTSALSEVKEEYEPTRSFENIIVRLHLMNGMRPSTNSNETVIDLISRLGKKYPIDARETGMNPILRRGKRSSNLPQPTANCNHDITERLSKNAEEVCSSIHDIDRYITHVKTISPVQLSNFNKESYKGIVKDYNLDLGNSHNNYEEWRQGDSIVNAIREAFLAAKNFELTFNREFESNQRRVDAINNRNADKMQNMMQRIDKLRADRNKMQELIAQSNGVPSDQEALLFLKDSLNHKQEEIGLLHADEERAKTEKEIIELIKFLELVAQTTGEIQTKAFQTAVRVEGFQENIMRDSSIFLTHRINAQSALKKLHTQRITNSNERVKLQNDKKNLEARISQKQQEILWIRNRMQNAEREFGKEQKRLLDLEKGARDKQIAGGVLLIIPVFGWIAGGILLGFGIADENKAYSSRMHIVNTYRSRIDSEDSQIKNLQLYIRNSESRISALNTKFNRLGDEIQDFSNMDKDLNWIQKDITSILPLVNKSLMSIAKMKEICYGVKQNLNDVIKMAKEHIAEGEKWNLRHFIYNNISALKCKWDQANVRIVSLGNCE